MLKFLIMAFVLILLCLETQGQNNIETISRSWNSLLPSKPLNIVDSTVLSKAKIVNLKSLDIKDSLCSIKKTHNFPSDSSQKESTIAINLLHNKNLPLGDSLIGKLPRKIFTADYFNKYEFNKYIKLDGIISNETYASNFVLPFTMNERIYSRFHGSPTITIYNLPLNVNFYYTTENNNVYNSNFITVTFDKDRYLSDLRSKTDQKIQEKMQILDKSKHEQIKGKEQIKLLKDSLKDKKNALSKIDLNDPLLKKTGLKKVIKDSILSLNNFQDTLNGLRSKLSMPFFDTSEWKQKAQHRLEDSLDYENSAKYARSMHKTDSILREIKRIEDQFQKVDSAINKMRKADSLANRELETLKQLMNNNPIEAMTSKLPPKIARPLGKFVSSLDKLNIGLTTPEFSTYSLSGVPVKGIHASYKIRQNNLEIVAGNTRDFQFSRHGFDIEVPKFENPLLGLKIGRKTHKGEIYFATVYSKQPSEAMNQKKNLVNSVGGNWKIKENFEIQGEFLTSYLSRSINMPRIPVSYEQANFEPILPRQMFWESSSFWLQSKTKLTQSTELTAKISQVNLGYYAVGAPFLRKNFKEYDIKIGQYLFKRKISITTTYKELSNNKTIGDSIKNQTKGYGFIFKTAFKKCPNIYAGFTPYFQGNNHPDTLFRTNNQFSLLTIMLYHQFKIKKVMLNTSINYAHSKTEFFRINNSIHETQLIGANLSVQFAKLNVQMGYQNSRTYPKIDSVSYDAFQLHLDYSFTKDLTIGLQGKSNFYLNGSIILPESWTRGLVKKSLNLTKHYDQTNPSQVYA